MDHTPRIEIVYREIWKDAHPTKKLGMALVSHLEPPKRRHILGLSARDAPVVGLVYRLVVFPRRLVVHREPLDGLGGQRLRRKEPGHASDSPLVRETRRRMGNFTRM